MTLKQKLADAEKSVRELSADKPQKEKELADVRQQIDQLQQQLASSQKQNQGLQTTVTDLRAQLDEASPQLEKAKLGGANRGRHRSPNERKPSFAQYRDSRRGKRKRAAIRPGN